MFPRLVLIIGIVASSPLYAHDIATASYLGNEGIMVQRGETKVLFDAFYAEGFGQYALVPPAISAALLNNEAPYDNIDAVFVSHVHGDHFSPESAIAFLRANSTVNMYGPEQIREAFLGADLEENDPVFNQLSVISLEPTDEGQTLHAASLAIDVVSVPHAGTWTEIQNYAWRVTLGSDTTILHMGDADPKVSNFSRHQAHFDAVATDAAFPPYWFLGNRDGELVLNDVIKAKQIIGIHVPKRAAGKGSEWRNRLGGDVFTDPGEKRSVDLHDH